MKKVKIALLGFGNVGRGVWKILQANGEEISKRSGYKVEVAKILVRNKNKDRGVDVPDEIVTTDFNEILNDDSIKIVVEVMGGIEPAKEYMSGLVHRSVGQTDHGKGGQTGGEITLHTHLIALHTMEPQRPDFVYHSATSPAPGGAVIQGQRAPKHGGSHPTGGVSGENRQFQQDNYSINLCKIQFTNKEISDKIRNTLAMISVEKPKINGKNQP